MADEPLSGLSSRTIQSIRCMYEYANFQDACVFFSLHQPSPACLMFVDKGHGHCASGDPVDFGRAASQVAGTTALMAGRRRICFYAQAAPAKPTTRTRTRAASRSISGRGARDRGRDARTQAHPGDIASCHHSSSATAALASKDIDEILNEDAEVHADTSNPDVLRASSWATSRRSGRVTRCRWT